MKLERFVVGAFQENCYLVSDAETGDAVLVDPGDDGERLLAAATAGGVALRAVWLTHAHLDHVGGIAAIRRRLDIPVYLHGDDLPLYEAAPQVAAMYGIPFELGPRPDRLLHEGDTVSVGALRFVVWHMPGHSPGHVIFHGHGVVFGGDVLFAGSVGRTDLPLSDGAAFQRTLSRMVTLPADTVVLPGHGPQTTIGDEASRNPFLTGLARPVTR